MNKQQIIAAVNSGKTVHWGNTAYIVKRSVYDDGTHDYIILCTLNDSCVGLTDIYGVLIENEEDFFTIK